MGYELFSSYMSYPVDLEETWTTEAQANIPPLIEEAVSHRRNKMIPLAPNLTGSDLTFHYAGDPWLLCPLLTLQALC